MLSAASSLLIEDLTCIGENRGREGDLIPVPHIVALHTKKIIQMNSTHEV